MNQTFSHLSVYTVFEENIPFPIILSRYLKYYSLIIEKYRLFMLHFIFFSEIFADSLHLNIYCFHRSLKKWRTWIGFCKFLVLCACEHLCVCVCVSMSVSACKRLEEPG